MLTQIVKGFITESRGDVIIKVSKIELNVCNWPEFLGQRCHGDVLAEGS